MDRLDGRAEILHGERRGIAQPQARGRGVGKLREALLALAHGDLGSLPVGDVQRGEQDAVVGLGDRLQEPAIELIMSVEVLVGDRGAGLHHLQKFAPDARLYDCRILRQRALACSGSPSIIPLLVGEQPIEIADRTVRVSHSF
ncbi:hypothetical protein, partial [Methylobacterium frigidaeris]|uniref:hypothetical protein n=1 Tax=Methylobacterium frigidaeris TaxID=2038277 RepID=UPI001FD2FAD6